LREQRFVQPEFGSSDLILFLGRVFAYELAGWIAGYDVYE
jgi:hypothetical protein